MGDEIRGAATHPIGLGGDPARLLLLKPLHKFDHVVIRIGDIQPRHFAFDLQRPLDEAQPCCLNQAAAWRSCQKLPAPDAGNTVA